MQLPEAPRQVLAGSLAAATFVGLYLPLDLAWFVALPAGLAVYGALLMLVTRKIPIVTITGEVNDAVERLTLAASRISAAAKRAPAADRDSFARMGVLIEAIAQHHRDDPSDFQHTRTFIRGMLDRIVTSVEGYVELAAKSRGLNAARLEHVRAQFPGFVTALEKVDQACLENDFMALEVEVGVLSEQLARRG